MVIFEKRSFQMNNFKFKKYVHRIYKIMQENNDSKKLINYEKRIGKKLKKYHKIFNIFHKQIMKIFEETYIKKFKKETKFSVMKHRVSKIGGERQLSLIVAGNMLLKNYFTLMRLKFAGILHLQRKTLKKIKKIKIVVNEGDRSISSSSIAKIEKFQNITYKTVELAKNNFNINNTLLHKIIQTMETGKFSNLNNFYELAETDDFNEFVCEPIITVFKEINEDFSGTLEYLISVLNLHLQYCNLRYYMKLSFNEFKVFYGHIYNEIEAIESVIDY